MGSWNQSMLETLALRTRPNSVIDNSKVRLIVGIDYGTTFSGVSYTTSDKASLNDIVVVNNWPGKPGEWKTPTRVAYVDENPQLRELAWGFGAGSGLTSCAWTKLLLDVDSLEDTYDDPNLKNARTQVDRAIFHRPPGKDPVDICEDFLREVYKFLTKRLENKGTGAAVLRNTPMDCYLTYPAVWSDKALELTMHAAKNAGFGARPGDTITPIREPEAAALTVLRRAMEPGEMNPPRVGENILVCDCGGGTVDISTYSIQEVTPGLEFEELCTGRGGKCGATYLDREMLKLLDTRFGEALKQVPPRWRNPGSSFMEQWETVKRDFSAEHSEDRTYRLTPLNIKGNFPKEQYDAFELTVILTKQDIQDIFNPVIDQIIRLVNDQLEDVKKECQNVDRLILIGGFGESLYLLTRLKAWARQHYPRMQVYGAEHSQAAIVKGAALRGLLGMAPRKRRCRRHYGVLMRMPFREGIDPESHARRNEWDDAKVCEGRIRWVMHKGATVDITTREHANMYVPARKGDSLVCKVLLYACAMEKPPDWEWSPRVFHVGTINVAFAKEELNSFEHKRSHGYIGSKVYHLDFRIAIDFGAEAGVLEVRSLVRGKETGKTTITFDT